MSSSSSRLLAGRVHLLQQQQQLMRGRALHSGAVHLQARRSDSGPQSSRSRRNVPFNFGFVIVPQQSNYIVERFGKFNRLLEPGLQFLIPFVDKISYAHSLKEEAINIPNQMAITRDNVTINIDGVLYMKVEDAVAASYGVEDPHRAISLLAQTRMRSELGKLTLDKTFEEREALNTLIVVGINEAAKPWGVRCLRYEIRDIHPPDNVRKAMELQAEAERRKRAQILDSEAEKQSDVNVAEGNKRSLILGSEAEKVEKMNTAIGEANSIMARSKAIGQGIELIASAVKKNSRGKDAVQLRVAELYIQAFKEIAKNSNAVVVPSSTGHGGAGSEFSSLVAQIISLTAALNKEPPKSANRMKERDPERDTDDPLRQLHT
mmetsp:Transcript_10979/g.33676  ORF Transcript_10979/g.33676 Transcript_10979/m.33676 type:complete len:377 (-) Transcript_10979:2177-3307(-)